MYSILKWLMMGCIVGVGFMFLCLYIYLIFGIDAIFFYPNGIERIQ